MLVYCPVKWIIYIYIYREREREREEEEEEEEEEEIGPTLWSTGAAYVDEKLSGCWCFMQLVCSIIQFHSMINGVFL